MPRLRNIVLPLILIGVGVLILLSNLGILTSGALHRLGDLWPLLLIIIGLQLVLNHTLPRTQATAIGLAATVVIVSGAVAFAALAPSNALGTQHGDTSARLNGLSAATLELDYSASSVEILTGTSGDNLYQAHVDYPAGENPPNISLDQQTGTVSISNSGGITSFPWFGSDQRRLTLHLSASVPWTIHVGGGASNLHLDGSELQVSNLEISGGATNVNAQLGQPKGTVGVNVSGGATNVTLRLPSGSQWSVHASGGVNGISINGQSSGGFGDYTRQSPGYTGASDRFDIQMSGGVSHLDLQTR